MSEMTLPQLKVAARHFVEEFSATSIAALYGITDGKAVGTHVEHAFHEFLKNRYSYAPGSSASGLDFPEEGLLTALLRVRRRESRIYLRSRDLGDFQTPPALVAGVLKCLGPIGKKWTRVLEPTCGHGNFIRGLLDSSTPPAEIQAIELQDSHLQIARGISQDSVTNRVAVKQANVFDLDLRCDVPWSNTGPLLIVGNPPWVTNAELGALGSSNLPGKTNLKGLRGVEALTGSSNFDIAEYIWLKLIRELAPEQPTIALLCKTAVARNVLQFAFEAALPITRAFIRRIDAKKWFGASVDACLFCVEVGSGERRYEAAVFPDLYAEEPESTMGFVNKRLVANVEVHKRSAFADGVCPVTWRQGLKHDAAPVMELGYDDSECLRNKLGEVVDVEPEYVYPLLKSSDLFHGARPQRFVIVPQKRLGESTNQLQWIAPRLWNYLSAHADMFERRKSSIYHNKPSFAVFGIGDYSFSPYKVGISGLHKTPRFRAIGPAKGCPVMLDDTSYFVACRSPEQTALLSSLLNDPACLELIRSMVFLDSKRPITKRLLQRINLKALLQRTEMHSLLARAGADLENFATTTNWQETIRSLSLERVLFDEMPCDSLSPQLTLDLQE